MTGVGVGRCVGVYCAVGNCLRTRYAAMWPWCQIEFAPPNVAIGLVLQFVKEKASLCAAKGGFAHKVGPCRTFIAY